MTAGRSFISAGRRIGVNGEWAMGNCLGVGYVVHLIDWLSFSNSILRAGSIIYNYPIINIMLSSAKL